MKASIKRALAGTALTLSLVSAAPPAHAMPISELQSDCSGSGGSWFVWIDQPTGYIMNYVCQYRDIDGTWYRDFYNRFGDYESTAERRHGVWVTE